MSDVQGAAPAAEAAEPVEAVENEVVVEETPEEIAAKEVLAAEEKKAEKKSLKKKYDFNANGKKREIELDLENDDEVKKYLSKAMAADERFEEAATIRKQAEYLVKMLKENPKMLLKHPELGLDVKNLATELLNEELEDMAKSPEQKRIEEMEKKLKDYEEDKKRLEDDAKQKEREKLTMEAEQQLDTDITAALSKTDLPKSPYVVKRIADTMIEAIGLGYEDVKVADIMGYVEEQILSEIQQMFESKPAATLEKLVGKKNLDAYRASKIEKTKTAPKAPSKVADSGAKGAKKDETQEKPKKFNDLFGAF